MQGSASEMKAFPALKQPSATCPSPFRTATLSLTSSPFRPLLAKLPEMEGEMTYLSGFSESRGEITGKGHKHHGH